MDGIEILYSIDTYTLFGEIITIYLILLGLALCLTILFYCLIFANGFVWRPNRHSLILSIILIAEIISSIIYFKTNYHKEDYPKYISTSYVVKITDKASYNDFINHYQIIENITDNIYKVKKKDCD